MNAKEKAEELLYKMNPGVLDATGNESELAKYCALICVDEMISQMTGIDSDYDSGNGYYQQVKQEIEKL